jgi:hypothetical protein
MASRSPADTLQHQGLGQAEGSRAGQHLLFCDVANAALLIHQQIVCGLPQQRPRPPAPAILRRAAAAAVPRLCWAPGSVSRRMCRPVRTGAKEAVHRSCVRCACMIPMCICRPIRESSRSRGSCTPDRLRGPRATAEQRPLPPPAGAARQGCGAGALRLLRACGAEPQRRQPAARQQSCACAPCSTHAARDAMLIGIATAGLEGVSRWR